MLASIGPIEIRVLLVALLSWAGVVAFVVFVARPPLCKTDQVRTTSTLVEENRRRRDALGERQGEDQRPGDVVGLAIGDEWPMRRALFPAEAPISAESGRCRAKNRRTVRLRHWRRRPCGC